MLVCHPVYRVIRNECRGFNNLSYTIHLRWEYMYFFYLIEQHSKDLLHTLQLLYMCIVCDSTDINTIIEFVSHVSGDGFNGGSDSYLQFRDTCTYRAPVRYVTNTWSVVLLNNKILILLSQVYCA